MSEQNQNPSTPQAEGATTIPDLDAAPAAVQQEKNGEEPATTGNESGAPAPAAPEATTKTGGKSGNKGGAKGKGGGKAATTAPAAVQQEKNGEVKPQPAFAIKRKKNAGKPPFWGNMDEDKKYPLQYDPSGAVVVRMADVRTLAGRTSEVEGSEKIQVFERSVYQHLKDKGAFKGKAVLIINE